MQELFKYDPAKAKKLLAEAGYQNGFTFKAQVVSGSHSQTDLFSLIAAYLEQVGVKIEIQPMEYTGLFVGDDDADARARLSHGQRPREVCKRQAEAVQALNCDVMRASI